MRGKEQLAVYTRALAIEEQVRSEINASIDARIEVINGLIEGTKKLYALANGSEPELDVEDETDSETEEEVVARGTTPKKKKSKKKSVAAASKKASKKVATKKAKPAKVFTKATSVPKTSKKNAGMPRLEDAIQIAMGNKELTAPEIHLELKARHWIPASKDPLGYIRYALSANPAIFRRREGVRGKYHLDPLNPYSTGKHKAPIEGWVNPKGKKAKSKEKGSSPTNSSAAVEAPSVAPVPVIVAPEVDPDNGEREDPSTVVSELLRDAGERAFGRQAPPMDGT